MKKPSSKVAHNSELDVYSLTALSCPCGQKMEFDIGNLAVAVSVLSTLWRKHTEKH